MPAGLDGGDVLFALYYVSLNASTAKKSSADLLEETIFNSSDLDDLGPDIFRSSRGWCGYLWVVARGYEDEVVSLFSVIGGTNSAFVADVIGSLCDLGSRHIRCECVLVSAILCKEVMVCSEIRPRSCDSDGLYSTRGGNYS